MSAAHEVAVADIGGTHARFTERGTIAERKLLHTGITALDDKELLILARDATGAAELAIAGSRFTNASHKVALGCDHLQALVD